MSERSRTLYRAMLPNGEEPVVGTDRDMLGLRDSEANLSIYEDPRCIRSPIRPRAVLNRHGKPGGNGESVLFSIDAADLAEFGLRVGRVNPRDTHGPIEAIGACDHDEAHRRIVATLKKWKKV